MNKLNVTYIISDVHHRYIAFEWIVKYFNYELYNLNFILLQKEESYLENFLKKNGIIYNVIYYTGKNKIELLGTIFKLLILFIKNKPDVIHTHIFDANLIGLVVGKLLRIKKRIYTRHLASADLLYYPQHKKYIKLFNFLSTDIIAVSEVVKNVLLNDLGANSNKIKLIHHGFDISVFENISLTRIYKIKKKYNLNNKIVIGVISRFQELKGIEYIIYAFKKILVEYKDIKLVLANANGPNYDNINNILKKELPSNSYVKIPFEEDIEALLKTFSIFIHVPISLDVEAFGQVYIEAMAAKIPCIVTKSGIANEIIVDKKNALVVNYKNSSDIVKNIKFLLNNKELSDKIITNAYLTIKDFDINIMIKKLMNLYIINK